MKRLTIYFSTIFILAASPALALIGFNSQKNINSALYTTQSTHATDLSEYDELRQDVTSCVTRTKNKKTPENYITKRTEEIKGNKLTRPINYDTQFNLSNNDRNPKTWRCSIDAQPNDKIKDEIEVRPVGQPDPTTKPEAEERCINEILRLTAADDWYVSECLSNRIKKKYNIETVDDYYTKIYQFYNKPESTTTTQQQTNNTSQSTTPANTNNNSASSKISVTVIDYYNNTGIKNITVCSNNNCEKSDKNGNVKLSTTTPQNIRIQGASDYHCDKPINKSAIADLNVTPIESTPRRSTEIKNSQNQFVIMCKKLCTDKDLQKLNTGLKQQNQIKSCYRKNQTEYEITKCNYVDSKPHNNQCKLYRNNITIAGEGIDINKVEISLSKTTSNFKPAKQTTAKDPLITIEDIDLDETKYISAKHGKQTIACEFKFPNNTKCDFDLLNDDIIEEDVSSDIIIDSTSNNKLNDTENKDNQQQNPNEKETKEQPNAIKQTITKEEYEQIESEINQILTDIEKQINSQCATEPIIEKCKTKDEIIKQIKKAAEKTLNKLNGAWK
ncbi:MAG: hypothetical protein IJN91_01335 [Alphaproteobacteria bacterium]|nr:hypothetical protein [Alphaproteobacteria bacterium]